MAQEAGATVTRETPIREFQTDRPAILDVTAFGTAEIVDLIIDVTVRRPTCKKYGRTDQGTERAATMAEQEKQLRYPPAGGRRVTTFAIETWGRLGPEAEQILQQLAAAARRRDQQRDRLVLNRIPKWRAHIDATNQRSIARRLLGAFLGTDGKPWRPPPHRRDPTHEANANRLSPGEQMTYPHTTVEPSRLHRWTDGQYDTYWPTTAADRVVQTQRAGQDTSQPQQPHQADRTRRLPATPQPYIPPHPSVNSGSELPPGLRAVNPRVAAQPAGQTAHGNIEWHQCVICLGRLTADGLNVCACEMPDSTMGQPQPQQHTYHLSGTAATTQRHDGVGESADARSLEVGAVSACTGSRSNSSADDSDSRANGDQHTHSSSTDTAAATRPTRIEDRTMDVDCAYNSSGADDTSEAPTDSSDDQRTARSGKRSGKTSQETGQKPSQGLRQEPPQGVQREQGTYERPQARDHARRRPSSRAGRHTRTEASASQATTAAHQTAPQRGSRDRCIGQSTGKPAHR